MDSDEAGATTQNPDIQDPDIQDSDIQDRETSVMSTASSQPDVAARIAAVRERLLSPMPDDGIWGWAGPLLVTAFAAFFRFYRLSVPHAVIFDETYYAKDAWSILQHGVEWNYIANPAGYPSGQSYANNLMLAGHTNIFAACTGTGCGEYVVQPEVGKYLIALGEWLFGLHPFGWRVASAFFGTLAVLVMCRVARRMTRSTLLGCVAGLLLSLDGLEFVLSRTGILDIFLMFFTLASFGALLVDRDASRARLAEAVVLRRGDESGPALGVRWWRVLSGFLIGVACACKQDAVWYIPAFIALSLAWDAGARRAAIAGTYVLAVLALFWYFYPILAGKIIPYSAWLSHMWYHGWI
jgi:dolichyl-phosphate-mannose-protein mannosyltransferase